MFWRIDDNCRMIMDNQKPHSPINKPSALLNFVCFLVPSAGFCVVSVLGNSPIEKQLPKLFVDIVCLTIEWSWFFSFLWATHQLTNKCEVGWETNSLPSPRKRQAAIFTLLGLIPVLLELWAVIGAGSSM